MGRKKDKMISLRKEGTGADVSHELERAIIDSRKIHRNRDADIVMDAVTPAVPRTKKEKQLAARNAKSRLDDIIKPSILTSAFPTSRKSKKHALRTVIDEYDDVAAPSKKATPVAPVDDSAGDMLPAVFDGHRVVRPTAPETSLYPNVEKPHGGISYNPTEQEQLEVLHAAASVIVPEEAEKARLALSMGPMMTRHAMDVVDERVASLLHAEAVNDAVDAIEYESAVPVVDAVPVIKKDTQKLSKRDLRVKAKMTAEQLAKEERRRDKEQNHDIDYARVTLKQINKDDKATELARVIKQDLDSKKFKKFGKRRYALSVDYQMPEDVRGSLRGMQVESSVLRDRFNSMQRRNLIETRVPSRTKEKVSIVRPRRNTMLM